MAHQTTELKRSGSLEAASLAARQLASTLCSHELLEELGCIVGRNGGGLSAAVDLLHGELARLSDTRLAFSVPQRLQSAVADTLSPSPSSGALSVLQLAGAVVVLNSLLRVCASAGDFAGAAAAHGALKGLAATAERAALDALHGPRGTAPVAPRGRTPLHHLGQAATPAAAPPRASAAAAGSMGDRASAATKVIAVSASAANAWLAAMLAAGKLSEASAVLDGLLSKGLLPSPNSRTLALAVAVAAAQDDFRRATTVWALLTAGQPPARAPVRPQADAFAAYAAAAGRAGLRREALAVLDRLRASGAPPSQGVYIACMAACTLAGRPATAFSLFQDMLDVGIAAAKATGEAEVEAEAKAKAEADSDAAIHAESKVTGNAVAVTRDSLAPAHRAATVLLAHPTETAFYALALAAAAAGRDAAELAREAMSLIDAHGSASTSGAGAGAGAVPTASPDRSSDASPIASTSTSTPEAGLTDSLLPLLPSLRIYSALIYAAVRGGDVPLAERWLQDARAARLLLKESSPPPAGHAAAAGTAVTSASEPTLCTPDVDVLLDSIAIGGAAGLASRLRPNDDAHLVAAFETVLAARAALMPPLREGRRAASQAGQVPASAAKASTKGKTGKSRSASPSAASIAPASPAAATSPASPIVELHEQMVAEDGLSPSSASVTALLRAHALAGDFPAALAAFERFTGPLPALPVELRTAADAVVFSLSAEQHGGAWESADAAGGGTAKARRKSASKASAAESSGSGSRSHNTSATLAASNGDTLDAAAAGTAWVQRDAAMVAALLRSAGRAAHSGSAVASTSASFSSSSSPSPSSWSMGIARHVALHCLPVWGIKPSAPLLLAYAAAAGDAGDAAAAGDVLGFMERADPAQPGSAALLRPRVFECVIRAAALADAAEIGGAAVELLQRRRITATRATVEILRKAMEAEDDAGDASAAPPSNFTAATAAAGNTSGTAADGAANAAAPRKPALSLPFAAPPSLLELLSPEEQSRTVALAASSAADDAAQLEAGAGPDAGAHGHFGGHAAELPARSRPMMADAASQPLPVAPPALGDLASVARACGRLRAVRAQQLQEDEGTHGGGGGASSARAGATGRPTRAGAGQEHVPDIAAARLRSREASAQLSSLEERPQLPLEEETHLREAFAGDERFRDALTQANASAGAGAGGSGEGNHMASGAGTAPGFALLHAQLAALAASGSSGAGMAGSASALSSARAVGLVAADPAAPAFVAGPAPYRRSRAFAEKGFSGGFGRFPGVILEDTPASVLLAGAGLKAGGAHAAVPRVHLGGDGVGGGGIRVPVPRGLRPMTEAEARVSSLAGIAGDLAQQQETDEAGAEEAGEETKTTKAAQDADEVDVDDHDDVDDAELEGLRHLQMSVRLQTAERKRLALVQRAAITGEDVAVRVAARTGKLQAQPLPAQGQDETQGQIQQRRRRVASFAEEAKAEAAPLFDDDDEPRGAAVRGVAVKRAARANAASIASAAATAGPLEHEETPERMQAKRGKRGKAAAGPATGDVDKLVPEATSSPASAGTSSNATTAAAAASNSGLASLHDDGLPLVNHGGAYGLGGDSDSDRDAEAEGELGSGDGDTAGAGLRKLKRSEQLQLLRRMGLGHAIVAGDSDSDDDGEGQGMTEAAGGSSSRGRVRGGRRRRGGLSSGFSAGSGIGIVLDGDVPLIEGPLSGDDEEDFRSDGEEDADELHDDAHHGAAGRGVGKVRAGAGAAGKQKPRLADAGQSAAASPTGASAAPQAASLPPGRQFTGRLVGAGSVDKDGQQKAYARALARRHDTATAADVQHPQQHGSGAASAVQSRAAPPSPVPRTATAAAVVQDDAAVAAPKAARRRGALFGEAAFASVAPQTQSPAKAAAFVAPSGRPNAAGSGGGGSARRLK